MEKGLIDTAAQIGTPEDKRIYGVVLAYVVSNTDLTGLGRVQIRLPWLSGFEPWARVGALMAGMEQGTYFIPQVGNEVLVMFNHGDIGDPYIIGCLWNGQDRPPAKLLDDPVNKRIIRTPMGHEIKFDDKEQSIEITSSTKQKISIKPSKIEISTTGKTASIKLDNSGSISIESAKSIDLRAPTINIMGTNVSIGGSASARIDGGGLCSIQAAMVRIN